MDTLTVQEPKAPYVVNEEDEKKRILREYRALLRALRERLKKGDRALVRRAFEMAVDAHKDMRRKSGEPYILHPLAVAHIVVEEIGLGVRSAICALLHDTVEDTELTLEDIEREFNPQVARIIDGLTKISNVVDIKAESTIQAENFRKILLTLADDPRVILIKLADRLHNMRTLESMGREKQLKISSETTYIYAPLAHRLGLYEIKSEMEDLAMKYTQPDVYEDIARGLKDTRRERARYINEFIKPIKEELTEQGFDFEIYGRPKAIHSIFNKMKQKHVTFDEVYDLFAIRIILHTEPEHEKEKEACWKVYSIVTDHYHPSTERLRDWVSVPKGNGYEALHTTVMGPGGRWVEVQIRTDRMNEIAEKGLAAHWKYKEGATNVQESKLDHFLRHLREIVNNPETDTLDFLQDFKLDLFTEEIYVYTPKGDMRVLPKGATALDFAFDIHTELGNHCIGAKVNYRLAPLSRPLNSGDQVEVITSQKQSPSEDWLQFLVTAKAKSGVKAFMKEDKRRTAEDGKNAIMMKLDRLGVPLSQNNLNELTQHFGKSSPLDLYYAIAVGSADLKEVDGFGIYGDKLQSPGREVMQDVKNLPDDDPSKVKPGKGELIIFGERSDKILYKLANCCQPIPGDNVFGFMTSGEGLKIHRTDCRNAPKLLASHGHRVVKTKWAKNKEISFLAGVRINGLDEVGVIQKIANVISGELKLNMRSLSIDSNDGIFDGTIMVYIHDREELNSFCNRLSALEGINHVERIESGVELGRIP